jgi:hypothetical protein
MNWLDVENLVRNTYYNARNISKAKLQTRFGFKLVDDFSYLMLMTDGIYDPEICSGSKFKK